MLRERDRADFADVVSIVQRRRTADLDSEDEHELGQNEKLSPQMNGSENRYKR
jgi:hypothetical protein